MLSINDENNEILARCLDNLIDHRQTIEACLNLYPDQQAMLHPLLTLSVSLNSAAALEAPPDFTQSARARLLLQIQDKTWSPNPNANKRHNPRSPMEIINTTVQSFEQWLFPTQLRWRTAGILISLALFLLFTTVISATAQSLPGDTLYPLKSGFEQSQLSITHSNYKDARLHISFTKHRLDEIAALTEKQRTQDIPKAVQAYKTELTTANTYLQQTNLLTADERKNFAESMAVDLTNQADQFDQIINTWTTIDQRQPSAGTTEAINEIRSALDEVYSQLDKLHNIIPSLPDGIIKTLTPIITLLPVESPSQPTVATPTPTVPISPSQTPRPLETSQTPNGTSTGWVIQTWIADPTIQWTPNITALATLFPIPDQVLTLIPTGIPNPETWPTAFPIPDTIPGDPDSHDEDPPMNWPTDSDFGFPNYGYGGH